MLLDRLLKRAAPAMTPPGRAPLDAVPAVAGDRFLFLAGLHRSGTSILHRLMREHPETSGFENTGYPEDEGQFLQSVYPIARTYGGPGRFGFHPEAHLTEAAPLVSAENRDHLLREWGAWYDLDKPVLLEKSPPHIIRSRFLQALFPGARFAFILRHPVAVALATRKWAGTSPAELVLHWLAVHATMAEDRPHLDHVLTFRYEDFVTDAPGHIARLCHHAGLEPHVPREDVRDCNGRYFDQWATGHEGDRLLLERMGVEDKLAAFGYSLRAPYVL